MPKKISKNIGKTQRQPAPIKVSQTITGNQKPPPFNYDTLKSRRKRAGHGLKRNECIGNNAKVFESHPSSDEEMAKDPSYRSMMKFHPEDDESGAIKLERLRRMVDNSDSEDQEKLQPLPAVQTNIE